MFISYICTTNSVKQFGTRHELKHPWGVHHAGQPSQPMVVMATSMTTNLARSNVAEWYVCFGSIHDSRTLWRVGATNDPSLLSIIYIIYLSDSPSKPVFVNLNLTFVPFYDMVLLRHMVGKG